MDTRATTRGRLPIIPVLIAFLFNLLIPLTPAALSPVAAADGIADYSQCEIGNPSSGLDCENWIKGILNATKNNYSEDEVVPQRLVIDFDDTDTHTVTLTYLTRKDSGSIHHAYDYLATWNHTYVNADRCQDLNPNLCVGGTASTFPIPSDGTAVPPGAPQPTSAHELPQANRQFVMYGGTITAVSAITHDTAPAATGSDFASVTISFDVTDADGEVMLLFGGHLASGFGPRGWGEGLGAADISGGPYHIRVTALDGESIGNRDNQIMSDAIQPLLPALTITKTPDGGSVNAGDFASFTVTVTNNGPGAATNVDIDDDLPEGPGATNTGLVWAEFPDTPECTIVSNNLHCDIASLADDASFSVTVRALTDAGDCGTLNNTAFADADNNAAVSDTGSINVICPALVISKTPDGEIVNAGEEIDFTITVTNTGPGAATNVDIDDHLPAGFTWSEDPDTTECSLTAHDGHQDLHCDIASLADDASFSVTVSAPTDAGDCSATAYLNTARADADNHAEVTNTGDITIQCPDVTVDKEPVTTPISAGEQGTFTLEVTNHGPGTATGVRVVDRPPAGTVWEVLDSDGFDCSSEVGGGSQVITCTLAELQPGAENARTITIGFWTSAEDCGSLLNGVRVTASNEPSVNQANNGDSATIVVECPGLNVLKEADDDPINAGEEASFTITIWNTGPGDAFDVELHDDLPVGLAWDFEIVSAPEGIDEEDCDLSSSIVIGGEQSMSIDCDFGTLEADDEIVLRVFADTDRTDCGELENTAEVTASNLVEMLALLGLDEPGNVLTSTATIDVRCAEIALEKENDAVGSVLPGTSVTYTLTLTVSDEELPDGLAEDVTVVDELPIGLENPTNISNGGTFTAATRTITWNLGDLGEGTYELTYDAVVADDVEDGEELVNAAAATSPNSQCPDLETLGPECEAESTVIVRVPTLVIDKVASAEVITISGPANALVATPSVVTWTLSYTLTNGPVTGAVITDPVPAGFTFLDASNGGTFANGMITWTFPGELTSSGFVTFRTTVNPATISRTAPTVNVATIDSNETTPDTGQDSVAVTVVPPPLGGTPTPRPPLPNTATGTGMSGEPVTVPVELLVAFLIGSLGALALANVRAGSRRR